MTESGRDFRVTVTVRNGRLMRAIEAAGFETLGAFAKAARIDPGQLSAYVTLRASPYNKNDTLSPRAERMALYLNRTVEELFPPAFLKRCLERNSVTLDMDAPGVVSMLAEPQSPEALLITDQALSQLDTSLAALPPRHQKVLRMRFGLDGGRVHTLDEVGAVVGATRERIRQIEINGIRRLAHRDRANGHKLRRAAQDLLRA